MKPLRWFGYKSSPNPEFIEGRDASAASASRRGNSNRPVGGEIVDVVDEAARGEQRDDLRRRLPGGLFV